MKKIIKIVLIIVIIIFLLIFFTQKTYKTIKTGNNNIKSEMDLIEYILNVSSYEAKIEVTVNSNKTTNKYVLEQFYVSPSYSKQIVKEPSNIKGLEIIYNQNNLEIKNSNLGLTKIYENYEYLNENLIWLSSFINNCKTNGYTVEQTDQELILKVNIEKYNYKGKLYINKENVLPTKIEIEDNSNKSKVYIEYKEIKLKYIYT